MKSKTLMITILIFGISAGSAFAQLTDDVDVTATVVAELSLTNPVNVAFGNVSQNTNPFIDPTGAAHTGVTSPTIGRLDVGGSSGASVIVSWNTDVTLEDASANTMAFAPDLYQGATSADVQITNGVAYSLAAASSDLYIGGTLTVGASQNAAAYSTATGSGVALTVDIAYN